jgi:hypothetical protein
MSLGSLSKPLAPTKRSARELGPGRDGSLELRQRLLSSYSRFSSG